MKYPFDGDLKCPMCGFNVSKPVNYGYHAKKMYMARKEPTQRALKVLANTIREYVPSDNNPKAQAQFLWAIKEIPDEIIVDSIENYIRGQYFAECKGYSYVKAIVSNSGKNRKKLIENERKRYGPGPPVKILK